MPFNFNRAPGTAVLEGAAETEVILGVLVTAGKNYKIGIAGTAPEIMKIKGFARDPKTKTMTGIKVGGETYAISQIDSIKEA